MSTTMTPTTQNRAALLVTALAIALAAAIVIAATGVFTNTAGAEETVTQETVTQQTVTANTDTTEVAGATEVTDAEIPEEVMLALVDMDDDIEALFDSAEFEAYDTCMDANLGLEDVEPGEHDDVHDNITHEAIIAAEEACSDQLPAEWAALDAEFEAFEACLVENGIDIHAGPFGDDPFGPIDSTVIVLTADGEQVIDMSKGAGSVTIESDGTNLTVTTSGDVDVTEVTWAEEDAAFEACEPELPADMFGETFGGAFGEVEMLDFSS